MIAYLIKENGKYVISNFNGTEKITPDYYKEGKHNIGKTRTDVWFTYQGQSYHGVQIGENNQTLRCKAIKKPSFAPVFLGGNIKYYRHSNGSFVFGV